MSESSELLSVAEALADGLPIDWIGLEERDPALAEDLSRLRAVQEIASAFRLVREPSHRASHDPGSS